jgi:hypothetical protein
VYNISQAIEGFSFCQFFFRLVDGCDHTEAEAGTFIYLYFNHTLDFYPLFLYYFSELFRQPFLLLFDAQIRIVEQQSVICFAQWTHFTMLVDVIPLLYVLKNFFEAAFLAFCF